MMPIPELEACIKQIEILSNECIDWYLLSLKKKDKYEKKICMLKYQQISEKRSSYIKRLQELTEYGYR